MVFIKKFGTITDAKTTPNGRMFTFVSTTTTSYIWFSLSFTILIWNFYWLFVSIVTMDLIKIVQVRPLFYFIFHKYIFLFVISYFEQIFIFTDLLLLWFNVKNRILVFHSIFDSSVFFCCRTCFVVLGPTLYLMINWLF